MAEETKLLTEEERLQKINERYARALELSEEKDELPAIATEEYHGPSEAMTALVRGSILAVVGYFTGRSIGRIMHPTPKPGKGQALATKMLAGTGATVLGIMGLQSGSKQVRDSRSQMRRMQNTIAKIYKKNEALKQELKEQLKGAGKLDASALDAVEEDVQEQIVQAVAEEVKIPVAEVQEALQSAEAQIDGKAVAELNEEMAGAIADEEEIKATAEADITEHETDELDADERDTDERDTDERDTVDEAEAVEMADLDEAQRFGHDEEGRRSGKKSPGDIIAHTDEIQTQSDVELEDTPETAVSMEGIQHEVIGPQQPQLGA